MSYVKVCGLTRESDIEVCADVGVSAVGLNLWPQSPRSVTLARAKELAAVVRGRLDVVAVLVDAGEALVLQILAELRPDRVQLHGAHAQAGAQRFARAYTAVPLANDADVEAACLARGDRVLVDAKDAVLVGGTGRAVESSIAARVARVRRTLLAGGLTPSNVAAAIAAVRPFGVDAASGLESAPGLKSPELVAQFVSAARAAFSLENQRV